MKPLLALTLILISFGCAQMSPLTGGYKDTIPPNILQSFPLNNSTNTNIKEFYFAFDEPVDASELTESLIISPYYIGNNEIKYKKNEVFISFDTSFTANTTYIINFAGGVKDITEGNDLIDAKIIFSTGEYIDSASVSGVAFYPLENKRAEGVLVGLYNEKDSFDLFEKKPTYFTFSDKSGLFKINNVKPGTYTLYAFKDENKNYIAEYRNEPFGYMGKVVNIEGKKEKVLINLYSEDLSELRLLRKRNRGNVYELVYSKEISDVSVVSEIKLDYSLNDNKNVIVYKNSYVNDSVFVVVKAFDKWRKATTDSLFVSFGQDYEFKNDFTHNFDSRLKYELEDTIYYTFELSKPTRVKNLEYKLFVDTVLIPDSVYYKAEQKSGNKFDGAFKVDKERVVLFVENHKKQYLEKQSNDSIISQVNGYYDKLNTNTLTFTVEKGAIISIENDTLKKIMQKYTFKGSDFFGELNGSVYDSLKRKNINVELVTMDLKKVYYNLRKESEFLFKYIPPGKYLLRLLFDKNSNSEWDYGSIISNQISEEIVYYEKEIEIRSNWVIEDLVFDVNKSVDFLFETLESEK